jgi:hypothetical protein
MRFLPDPLVTGLASFGFVLSGFAQEHPFIASYTLTEFDGGIRLDWTIQGGSTCDGQDVERSTDGVSFTAVHRILGICGDPTVAVPFTWLDDDPPEFSTVYYRVKLGLNGYTSVKSVVFDQLTKSDQRFFPSPTTGEATLLINNAAADQVELRIYDAAGKLVHERSGLSGRVIPISVPELPSGVFLYLVITNSKVFSGRFVKE